MPSSKKILREDIITVGLDIAKEKGMEGINARDIAKKLGCSVQPIFYQFQNMDELKKEVYMVAEQYCYNFLLNNKIYDVPKYKQVGLNYVKFAKKEKKLFQILFMNNSDLAPDAFVSKSGKDYEKIEKLVRLSTNLNDKEISEFHTKMWIFVHGLSTLLANETIKLNDKQISELISGQFQALMLLEENPNNKWKLPKREEN